MSTGKKGKYTINKNPHQFSIIKHVVFTYSEKITVLHLKIYIKNKLPESKYLYLEEKIIYNINTV